MIDLNNLFLFIFIFSILNVFKISFIFIKSLLQNPPQKMVLSSRVNLLLHLTLTYIITYIIAI
jgi:hypothetical protein